MQMGSILVSFNCVSSEFNYHKLPKHVDFTPTHEEYKVEINVLGLRDLESVGLIPVKNAYIKFNLASLLPPTQHATIQNLKTQP